MYEVTHILRFLTVHVINPQANQEKAVHHGEELESLITTLGGTVVGRVIQKRENPDLATFVGKGKIQEVVDAIKETHADVVVLNATAKPRQVHALKQYLLEANPQIEVWDRIDLILHIFDKHATTTEAKLQIELARMRYMGPRIYGMGFVLSRQGGGIGTSGIGETNTELMKRHWRNEMKKVTDQLEKVSAAREEQVRRRQKAGLKTVSLVGYTNAGKSSLFNLLTGKDMLVENALFATLDSTSGRVYLPQTQSEVLVTDTIGFIRNLPPRLINAFQSTLMESMYAEVILHVVDASDPEIDEKIHVVKEILQKLGRNKEDVIYVFNKIDRLDADQKKKVIAKYKEKDPVYISATEEKGIEQLQDAIAKQLNHGVE
jgi:GTPase